MRGRRWTHVGLPQILRWYHCLQLVKYFLLVPLSCCIAQTFGLEDRRDIEESFILDLQQPAHSSSALTTATHWLAQVRPLNIWRL